jgi:PKD repeat protein
VGGQLDRRPGYRRLNQQRYSGPVQAIIDVQRICDYAKILVCSGLVFEHEEEYIDSGGGGGGHGGGDIFINPVIPNLPPFAVALGAPVAGPPPHTVQFNGAASWDPEGFPLAYLWNFGDGNFSNLPNPLHVYALPGNYNAQLTVTDVLGAVGVSVVIPITVAVPIVYGTWNGAALGTSWRLGP